MRYAYYVQPINEKPKKVSRSELIKQYLSKWCVKHESVLDGWADLETVNEKTINKVLRAITVGNCHSYILVGRGSVWAKKEA